MEEKIKHEEFGRNNEMNNIEELYHKEIEISVDTIKQEHAVNYIKEVNQKEINKLEEIDNREQINHGEVHHKEDIKNIEDITLEDKVNQTDVINIIKQVSQKEMLNRVETIKQEESVNYNEEVNKGEKKLEEINFREKINLGEIYFKEETKNHEEKANKDDEVNQKEIDSSIVEINQKDAENKKERNHSQEVNQGKVCHKGKTNNIELNLEQNKSNKTDLSNMINEVNQKEMINRVEAMKKKETNQKEVVNLKREICKSEEINQREKLDQRQVEVYKINEGNQNKDLSQEQVIQNDEVPQDKIVNHEAINKVHHNENVMLKVSNDNCDATKPMAQALTYKQRRNQRRKANKVKAKAMYLQSQVTMSEMVIHPPATTVPVLVPKDPHRADLVTKNDHRADLVSKEDCKADLVPKSAHKANLVSKDTHRADLVPKDDHRSDFVPPNAYLRHMANLFSENSEQNQRADFVPKPTPSFSAPLAKGRWKKKSQSSIPVSDPQRPMNSEPGHRANLLPKPASVSKGPLNVEPDHRADLFPGPVSYAKRPRPIGPSHKVDLLPDAKRPRHSEPDHQFASSHTLQAASQKVTILPLDYPATLLTAQQAEDIRDQLTFMIDQLDVKEGLHPQFSGFSLKSGACVLCCDSQNTKAWLINCIDKICISNNVKLRISGLNEIYKNVRVGVFFPGKMIPDNLLLKRFSVQNPNIPDIKKWILVGGKMENRGFFGVLKIPKTSFKFLEKQNLQVSYGMSKVKLKYLEAKGGSYSNKKKRKSNESGNSIKNDNISSSESDRKNTPSRKISGTNKVPNSDLKDYRNLGSCFKDNAPEYINANRSAGTQSKKTNAWMLGNHNGFSSIKSEKGTACESVNYHGPVNTEAEIGITWETGNYGRPASRKVERDVLRESANYDEHIIYRLEQEAICRPKRWETDCDVEPHYTGPNRRVSKNYDDTPHNRSEREMSWQSDSYVWSCRLGAERELDNYHRPESEDVWDSDDFNGAPRVRTEGRESDIYTGSTNIRPIRGVTWESCDYSRPNSVGKEERDEIDNYGRPMAPDERAISDNYGRSANIRPEQRATFEHYDRPARIGPQESASWEYDNYCGLASIKLQKRKTVWESDNYCGPPGIRPEGTTAGPSGGYSEHFFSKREIEIDWKSDNYNGPASIRPKGGVACGTDSTRHNEGTSRESDNYSGQIRSERGAAWESAHYGSPVEKFPLAEDGISFRNERSRPQTSQWQSAHSDWYDWNGCEKVVDDSRTARSRSETRRRMSAHDDRYGQTRDEKSSRTQRRPEINDLDRRHAKTRTERISGRKPGGRNSSATARP